jgi:repressor LexA
MREISHRHRLPCQYIAWFTHSHGWPPSRREMQQALGLSSTSHVAYYLESLEQQGYVHCEPYVSRGVTLTPQGAALAERTARAEPGRWRLAPPQREQGRRRHQTWSHPPKPLSPC